MRRQSVLLIGGLLLGLLGAALTFTYVRGVQSRTEAKGQTIPVFVAQSTIPAGTTGAAIAAMVQEQKVPKAYAAPAAIQDIGAIATLFSLRQIDQGQTLVATDFGSAGTTTSHLAIPKGLEAVSVATTLDSGLAQYAGPGDHVSVYATFKTPIATTRKILANILVLATRANPEAESKLLGNGQPASPGGQVLFVLAVTPKEAGRIIFAEQVGTVSFTLIPEGQTSPAARNKPIDTTGGLSKTLTEFFKAATSSLQAGQG